MPAITLADLGHTDLSPADLEHRRRAIIDQIKGNYDDASETLLNELAVITSTLRRKNAGPPKAEKKSKSSSAKMTVDDL